MKKLFPLILLSLLSLQSKAQTSTTEILSSAEIQNSCAVKMPQIFDFGVVDFTKPATATVIPKHDPFMEMGFSIDVICSPGVQYTMTYSSEERASPSGILIDGIIMYNTIPSVEDFFVGYVYSMETKALLTNKVSVIKGIGNGSIIAHPMYVGLQNLLKRGYPLPRAGYYVGNSVLSVSF